MRYVEHRRHAQRAAPGEHLVQAGVDAARRAGAGMGPFARVVTSPAPRAFETAIAMGFAVDALLPEGLSVTPPGMGAEIEWTAPFAAYQRAVRRGGVAAGFAGRLADYHRTLAAALPEGASALIVSHLGIVEPGAIGSLPDFDFTPWGPPCGYCEGVRLRYEGDRCVGAALLRVAP